MERMIVICLFDDHENMSFLLVEYHTKKKLLPPFTSVQKTRIIKRDFVFLFHAKKPPKKNATLVDKDKHE